MIKVLKAAIAEQKRILFTLQGAENPQLVELRIQTQARLDTLEAVLDYLCGYKAILKTMTKE